MSKTSKITASELVLSAIFFLQKKNGITAKDITKFICEKRGCRQSDVRGEVKRALERATENGIFSKKRGLYRIESGFGKNKISIRVRGTHKNRRMRKPRNQNSVKNPEHIHSKTVEKVYQAPLFASPNIVNLGEIRDWKDYYGDREVSPMGAYRAIDQRKRDEKPVEDDDDDDDDDFLEDEEDDEDDVDYFADEQFPETSQVIRDDSEEPPKRKPVKRKGMCRSKSRNKSKSKKRKLSKPRKKSQVQAAKRKRNCRRTQRNKKEEMYEEGDDEPTRVKTEKVEGDGTNEKDNQQERDEDDDGPECDEHRSSENDLTDDDTDDKYGDDQENDEYEYSCPDEEYHSKEESRKEKTKSCKKEKQHEKAEARAEDASKDKVPNGTTTAAPSQNARGGAKRKAENKAGATTGQDDGSKCRSDKKSHRSSSLFRSFKKKDSKTASSGNDRKQGKCKA